MGRVGRVGEGKGWHGSWEDRVRKGEAGEMKGEKKTRSTNVRLKSEESIFVKLSEIAGCFV